MNRARFLRAASAVALFPVLGKLPSFTRHVPTVLPPFDATDYLQALIDATPEGGVIYFPPGRWLMSKPLFLHKPVSLVGSHYNMERQYANFIYNAGHPR